MDNYFPQITKTSDLHQLPKYQEVQEIISWYKYFNVVIGISKKHQKKIKIRFKIIEAKTIKIVKSYPIRST